MAKAYVCQRCNKTFESRKGCKTRTPKFCSNECYAETLKKYKNCAHCGVQFAKWANERFCSAECQQKNRKGVPLSSEWRKKLSQGRKASQKCKGPNLYNWKGGKETERIRMKSSFYKRKMALTKPFDYKYLNSVYKAQQGKCFFCESDLLQYKAIEHLTPVSRGGDNDNFNLVYSCKSCNSKKRQQTLEEFSITYNRFDWLEKFDYIYANSIH